MAPAPRIIIDAGHGGSERAGNSSAYGASGPRGVVEKDVTLDIAKHVVARLGGAAALTRTRDRNLTIGARAARGQRSDIFVSIHANYGAPELSGPEVYVHPEAGRGSCALAGQIARALDRQAGRYGGGAEERRAAMAVLNPSAIGQTAACLVEVDYLSNPRGEQRLGDPGERAAIGAAIASAIQQHLASSSHAVGSGSLTLQPEAAPALPAPQSQGLSDPTRYRDRPPAGFFRVHMNTEDFVDLPADDTNAMYVDNNIVNFGIQPVPVTLEIDRQPLTLYYRDGAEVRIPTLSSITDDFNDGTYLTYVSGTHFVRCDRNFRPMYNAFTTPRLHWLKRALHDKVRELRAQQLEVAQVVAAFSTILSQYSSLDGTVSWARVSSGGLAEGQDTIRWDVLEQQLRYGCVVDLDVRSNDSREPMSHAYPIDTAGKVKLPMLGLVDALDVSLQTLAHRVQNLLTPNYYVSPTVNATLKRRIVSYGSNVTQPRLHVRLLDSAGATQNDSGWYPVRADGTLNLPYVGSVMARGRRLDEVEAEVEAGYRRDYLVNAVVHVTPIELDAG